MTAVNYQKQLEAILETDRKAGLRPSLLLHACCAPCSSYVLEYLASHFRITVFFFNPNISPKEEYSKREEELRRLISEMNLEKEVGFISGAYNPDEFFLAVKGLENEPEGAGRCEKCFSLRLEASAKAAREGGFDYFTTTLTISPHKNAPLLNRIGQEKGAQYGVEFLPSDFKKNGGFQRSIELSKEYGLYRQNYCGCVFSKEEQLWRSSGADASQKKQMKP